MNAPVAVHVKPRFALLARASVACSLVEAGEIDLDEAFGGLIEPFLDAFGIEDEIVGRWERNFPYQTPTKEKARPRQAAASTIDALIYGLRTHGEVHLEETDCQRRLDELSRKQFDELITSLRRAQPPISNELILKLERISNGQF